MDGCFGARESTFPRGGGYVPHAKSPEFCVSYEAFACTEINWKTASVNQRLKPSLSINLLNRLAAWEVTDVATSDVALISSLELKHGQQKPYQDFTNDKN